MLISKALVIEIIQRNKDIMLRKIPILLNFENDHQIQLK